MTRLLALLCVFNLLGACNATGPVYPVNAELYNWVTAPDTTDPLSDETPAIADPLVTFRLTPGERRSMLRAPENWYVGQTYLFGFDVRLDHRALGSEPLTLSRFAWRNAPETEIFSVELDRTHGVTVFGRTCIAPAQLADWHRVEVRIRMSDRDRGFLEVFCDRAPIWARTNLRTTLPPECRLSAGCTTPVPKSLDFDWHVGLLSDRAVSRTVTVQMQRLHYRTLLYVPGRAGTL